MAEGDDWERAGFVIRWNSYPRILMEAVSNLLCTGQFADVRLMCEGQTIKCHRFILQAFSPHLAKMVEEIDEHGALIYLGNGIKFKQLQTLLTFMYTGAAGVSPDEITEFLKAAEELKIRGLSLPDTTTNGNGSCGQVQNVLMDSEDDDDEGTTTTMDSNGGDGSTVADSTVPSVCGQSSLQELKSEAEAIASAPPQTGLIKDCDTNDMGYYGSGPKLPVPNEAEGSSANDNNEAGFRIASIWHHEVATTATAKKLVLDETGDEHERLFIAKKSARKRDVKSRVRVRNVSTKMKISSSTGPAATSSPGPTSDNMHPPPVLAGITKKKGKKSKKRRSPLTVSPYGESMKKAIESVLNGGRVSKAAIEFNIPISTLSKYVKNPERMKSSKMYYYV